MYGHPGKKLLFMGSEFGQWNEWNQAGQLDWMLLDFESHCSLQQYVKDLNKMYASEPALHEVDFSWEGFQWIDFHDVDNSIVSFIRRARDLERFRRGGGEFHTGGPEGLPGRCAGAGLLP